MNRKLRRAQEKQKRTAGQASTPAAKVSALLKKGNEHLNEGRHDEAESAFREILSIDPENASAFNNLGTVAVAKKDLAAALESFHRATQIKSDNARYFLNLGNALIAMGRKGHEAKQAFLRVAAIDPNSVTAYHNLGSLAYEIREYGEALAYYRKALEVDPQYIDAVQNMAMVFMDVGRTKEALICFRRWIELDPHNYEASKFLSTALKQMGDRDEARLVLRDLLEETPKDAAAISALAELVDADEYDALIEKMEDLLSLFSIDAADQEKLSFALGTIYSKKQDYDRAFTYWDQANALHRKGIEYDADGFDENINKTISIFDEEMVNTNQNLGCSSNRPIFILGMPRSGTTLTEQIISSHSTVFGAGELSDMVRIVNGVTRHSRPDWKFPDTFQGVTPEILHHLGELYVKEASLLVQGADLRFTDKMPLNFKYLGLIKMIMPNAKIIHCQRNPADVCLSIYQRSFTVTHSYSYDLGELGHYYRGYRRLMDHWRAVLPEGAFLDVRYEDTVADQEGQTRRILDFCDLEWEDACLDFHKTERIVSTASLEQVRKPMYQSSVARWKRYEKHLTPLFDALGDDICTEFL